MAEKSPDQIYTDSPAGALADADRFLLQQSGSTKVGLLSGLKAYILGATQSANTVLAGPTTGAAAAPAYRALVEADIPSLAATKVTSGTFDAARIPNLDAAKINAGTFNVARIPDLDAAKITAGTLDAARIPNLDAAKIATGVFDPAQIPPGLVTVQTKPSDLADMGGSEVASVMSDKIEEIVARYNALLDLLETAGVLEV